MIRDAWPDDARAIALVHIRSWQQAYRELLSGDYLKALDSTLTQREALWRQSINDRTQQVFVGWPTSKLSAGFHAVPGVITMPNKASRERSRPCMYSPNTGVASCGWKRLHIFPR